MSSFTRASLGTTGIDLPVVALGTAALGGWPVAVDVLQGVGTVNRAWDLGIRYFDTAPFYGYGKSEGFLREALADRPRDDFVLSTKVGRVLEPGAEAEPFYVGGNPMTPIADFSAAGIRRSLTESLDRLGTDRVDLVYIHDPDDAMDQAIEEAVPALVELRDAGTIGAIGVGMNWAEPLTRFAEEAPVDCIMEAGRYTLLEQDTLDDLLPAAQERGIGIIAGGVFNSGILADPRPGATYTYAPAPEAVLGRAHAIRDVCREYDVPLRAAALQLPLAHPAVKCVMLGATSPDEVDDCLAMLRRPIPSALWSMLKDRALLRPDTPIPTETGVAA